VTVDPTHDPSATDSLEAVARGRQADLVPLDAAPTGAVRSTQRSRAVEVAGNRHDRAAPDALRHDTERAPMPASRPR
jgi:hypothetical protein